MSKEAQIAEVCTLFSSIVRAMVSEKEFVKVTPIPSGPSTVVRVTTAKGSDTGKVIGKQGRTARSLRIVLSSIAKEQGLNLLLDIADPENDLLSGTPSRQQ